MQHSPHKPVLSLGLVDPWVGSTLLSVGYVSGVARNFGQGVRRASVCSIPSYPSLLSCPTKSALQPKRHDMNRLYEQLGISLSK